MKPTPITVALLTAGSLLLSLTLTCSAQEQRPQGGPGRRGPGGDGGPMRTHPVVAALDTNNDGTLSADEIANAPVALRKLDKNGDGKLTEDELRPNFGRGQGGPGSVSPADMVKRLLEFDKNNDGKLAKDELPERMQAMIERADTDKDGVLSRDELTKMAEAQAATAAGPGRGGREGREGRGERETRPAQPQ